MKRIVIDLIKITIPTLIILLLILEMVFRWVIPAAETPERDWNAAYSFSHYKAGQTGCYTMGTLAQERYEWRINKQGWNVPFDYQTKKDSNKLRIAIIGDSFVEAFQTDCWTNSARVLANLLDTSKSEVYSFGLSGSPFSQYLHLSRYVNQEYTPDILVFNMIHNDFSESIKENIKSKIFLHLDLADTANIREIKPIKIQNKSKYYYLEKSAFFRFLFYNVRINQILKRNKYKKNKKKYAGNLNTKVMKQRQKKIELAVQYIITTLKKENPYQRLIFMMDGIRQDIYANDMDNQIDIFSDIMQHTCEKENLEFISLMPVFKLDFQTNQTQFNSSFEGHWNTYGHQVVGRHLATYLKKTTDGFAISLSPFQVCWRIQVHTSHTIQFLLC